MNPKISADHLKRRAIVYIRQSSPGQVIHNQESQRRQYGLADHARQAITSGSTVITDGHNGYDGLERFGFQREIYVVGRRRKNASEVLPRVHLVISLLKRWLLGTHQGAISREHLDYYLDEFTFRFNRRSSRSRGKLFLRLAEQAVAVGPAPYKSIVKCFAQSAHADHNM